MRILLDANIWISYLLAHSEQNIIRRLVSSCIGAGRLLILPPELIAELKQSIIKYPYLGERITQAQLDVLLQELAVVALIPRPLEADFPRFSRDQADDYLLGHGLLHQVDYLVTGDKDLLVLGVIEQLHIVSPVTMRDILQQQGWWI